jgi:hypothetical protein
MLGRDLLTSPVAPHPPAAVAPAAGGASAIRPFHLLLAVTAVALGVRLAAPIVDIDSYWHVVVGREILATGRIAGAGDAWAWYDPADPWVSSQWLSEVAFAGLVDTFGWRSLVVFKVVGALLLLTLLWRVLRRRADVRIAALVTSGVVAGAIPFLQERPNLISLVLTVLVADAADAALGEGRLLRWWWVPATVVWANLHGQWFLLPLAVGIASVLHATGQPPGAGRFLRDQGLRVLAVLAAGCLTPLGPQGLLLPLQFRRVTGHLGEWQAPSLAGFAAVCLVVVMLGFALAWSRGRFRVPMREVVYVVGWVSFGLVAGRNLPVAAVLLAPLLARHLQLAFPARPRNLPARERRVLAIGLAVIGVAGVLATTLALLVVDPLRDTRALAIARSLADRSGEVLIFNDYNTAGSLVAFGPAGTVLAIDGRAERYGTEYVERHSRVINVAGRDWAELIDEMDPQVAVVEETSPLRHVLVAERGWRETLVDGDFVLLERPSEPASPDG